MPTIKRGYLGFKAILAAAMTFCFGIIPGFARTAQSSAQQERNPLIQRLSDSRTYDVLMAASKDTSRNVQANEANQMFVDRCQPSGEIHLAQSDRMKNYREYQANRKTFDSPENWLEPETKHKAAQKSESEKLKLQPKQAIRLSPARQPKQAIRLSPARQPKQAIRLSPARQPKQAIRLSPARQPKQAIRLSPATKSKQSSNGSSTSKKQPRQAIRLSPASQPQQAIRLSPAIKLKKSSN